MELRVEPRLKLILVVRDAALEAQAGFSMFVVPDHCPDGADYPFSRLQEQDDPDFLTWVQGRRGAQRHSIAANVDCRAPDVCCCTCWGKQNRKFGAASEITPALTDHKVVSGVQRSPNFFDL